MADNRAESEADQHIQRIRAGNGLDEQIHVPQAIIKNLESAVRVLAEQLYQKSTHFLLELVQNADDNHYEVEDPTLHLTYGAEHLRVDCNEIGFLPENVEAICSIGQSSKAGAGVSTKYVGEKGIGFKSVFKAADVVWVSSREYEFKFDKSARLGMIAPILAKFPHKRRNWTSFYLQLASGYDVQELISDLNDLGSHLLIFLRRLRTIVITMVDDDGTVCSKRTLTRAPSEIEGKEAVHLDENGHGMDYLIIRHTATNLPLEEKREGVRKSELLLAFPVDDKNEPKLDSQEVFAFLPVRDYGFKFMIQADFLLIASREDIDNSSRWNQSLRDQFVDAFLGSIAWFNSGTFRYTWIRYLPPKPESLDFFSSLKSRLLDRLSSEPVLESRDEKIRPGSGLTYVPEVYMDHNGAPLTLTPPKFSIYVSNGYSHDDAEQLKLLGVAEMDNILFLDHLEAAVRFQPDFFSSKVSEWHTRLAMVLVKIWESPSKAEPRRLAARMRRRELEMGTRRKFFGKSVEELLRNADIESEDVEDNHALQERIKKLPVIPLRGGQWSCASENIFFPGEADHWELPGGINLLVVDADAARNVSRANLFRVIGVQDFKIASITQMIVANHSDTSYDPTKISRSDLISQVLFLYTTGWRNIDGKQFWFATENDERALSTAVYVDDEIPHSASKYFGQNRKKFQFIHSDYQTAHPRNQSDWLSWLNTNMNLSNIPRLTRPIRQVAPQSWIFEMSHEFEFIIQHWSPIDAITLLCTHWETYKPWIEPLITEFEDPAVEESYRALKKRISAILVKTIQGEACRLDETFLPLKELRNENDNCVPFLDIPEPEHARWQVLATFGVGVKQDIDFWLRCLDKICGTECKLERATYFYEQIQARCNDNEAKVKKFFRDKKQPIYTPWSKSAEVNPDSGAWFPVHQAVWSGPKCLRVHVSISEVYPSCKRLFTDVLHIIDATMRDLIFEAVMFKKTDPLHYMRDVYIELEKFLETDESYDVSLQPLVPKNVWPIEDRGVADTFQELMSISRIWFIADTLPLRMSFTGIIPLLAFAIDEISRMERIIQGLKMDQKRLSLAAKSLAKTEGDVSLNMELTALFQSKYEFIARLVQPSTVHRDRRQRVLTALQKMNVFTADNIIQRYLVNINGTDVEGRQIQGNVVLTPEVDCMNIYLKEGYIERGGNPYELSEKLATYTGIDELTISTIFEHYGIPLSYEEDDWTNNPRMAGAPKLDDNMSEHVTESFTVISSCNSRYPGSYGDDPGISGIGGDSDPFSDGLQGDQPLAPGFRVVAVPNGFRNGGRCEDVDEELEFIGESFVCETLAKEMADSFNAEEHWISQRRTRAGLSKPTVSDDTFSFVIKDSEGKWTDVISRAGFPDARAWRRTPPTWHLIVKTTRGPLDGEFTLSAMQFEKARQYAVGTQKNRDRYGVPSDVVLLVRVFNASKEEPDLRLFIDPWDLYVMGTLQMKTSGTYFGKVGNS